MSLLSARLSVAACLVAATVQSCDTPTRSVLDTAVPRVSTGVFHTCALTAAGVAYCWGRGLYGALGTGDSTNSATPVRVSGVLTFASISAGYDYTCAIGLDQVTYCWGANGSGQLGNATTTPSSVPVAVSGGRAFHAISASPSNHVCALDASGAAYCWGANSEGQLGNGSTDSSATPIAVSGGLTFVAITAGGFGTTCGITPAGAAYCWGRNGAGESGVGNDSVWYFTTPMAVAGALAFRSVSTGIEHACGVATDGRAYCWGSPSLGNLGNDATANALVPQPVFGNLTFAAVTGSWYHTCALSSGGAAFCWGANIVGALGNGATDSSASRPTPVAGGLTFRSLSAGDYRTCGVTSNGTIYCWGYNADGEVGDGTAGNNRYAPVLVQLP